MQRIKMVHRTIVALIWLLAFVITISETVTASRRARKRKARQKLTRQPTIAPTSNPTIAAVPGATNYVILLADDLGYADVDYNGGAAVTGNITNFAFAKTSFRFNNLHSGSSVCSPTRASLLTGRHPERDCVTGANRRNRFPIRAGVTTVARDALLAGYRTAFFGKWHLGSFDSVPPSRKGFQTYIGSENNIVTYDAPCFCDELKCEADYCSDRSVCAIRPCRAKRKCYTGWLTTPDQFHDAYQCQMDEGSSSTNVVTRNVLPGKRMSCDFLADSFASFLDDVPSAIPILAVVAFNEPHMPYIADPAKRMQCESASSTICLHDLKSFPVNSRNSNYFGVLSSLDDAVGKIRLALEKTKRLNNTFLIFASDNGPEEHSRGGAGSAAPFRGFKRSLYEGGHRVAGFLHWPTKIQENTLISSRVSLLDIRPTILEILKSENPNFNHVAPEQLDGESFFPLIGAPHTWARKADLGMCSPVADTADKIVICQMTMLYVGDMKVIVQKNKEMDYKRIQLFNITADPSETTNLASRFPNLAVTLGSQAKSLRNRVSQDYQTYCSKLK